MKMRLWLVAIFALTCFVGCETQEENKGKSRVKAPFVDVHEKEDGSTHIKAPFVDIKTDD